MKTSLFCNPLNSSDLKNRKIPDVRDHVLKGFSRGTYGLLIADEGVGKSGLAHLLGTDIAAGLNMSGLNPITGKVMIISLEDRELDWSTRQRAIDQDLTVEQLERVKKNMQVHDLKEYTNSLSNKVVYEDLLEAGRNFKPDLIIIDYLDKWAENDLVDVAQAKNITKSIEQLALKLNCGVLFLHHTNKGNGDDNRSTRDKTSGAMQYQRNTKWRGLLEKTRKSTDKNEYILSVEKARCPDYKIEYLRRDDRCGIPYCKIKQEKTKEFNDDCVDLKKIGGRYPSTKVVPMNSALIKQDGVFGSFTSNQKRPKLDVKIELGDNSWVHIIGPDMLGALDGRLLVAIAAKINESGIRLCIPNKSKLYGNIIECIEDNCSYTMQIDTTINELHKMIKISKEKAGGNFYNAIRKSIVRLRTSAIIYRNRGRESALNLLDHYYYEDSTRKIEIRLNPFLVDAILGIGGVSFTQIPTRVVKTLESDNSFILYQRIRSIVRNSDKLGILFKIDTLLGYLYPEPHKNAEMKKERSKSLRKAISEITEKTELAFSKEDKFHWRVTPTAGNR